jgi:NADH dehydrogenase
VVVGAGFAGIEVAKALEGAAASVTVIDRNNYFLFQPLLYQVATAALSPADVATPVRALLRAPNIEILLGEVVGIDTDRRCVQMLQGDPRPYDVLVLAPGSHFNYFGHADWRRAAPAPKTLSNAIDIRQRVLLAFERAEMCAEQDEQRALMTFVIVGGGATGVEMAGAIAELAKATLSRDFRRISPSTARIVLIESDSRVLPTFPKSLGAYADATLKRKGVEVMLNTKVDAIDDAGVDASGTRLAARTVIWAAGVKANAVGAWLGIQTGAHGTVKVKPDFSVDRHPNIFVLGDAAEVAGSDGKPLPGLAAVAKQQGKYLGDLIRRRIEGKDEPAPFRYTDYGTMAIIGRSAAVADLRGFKITGFLGWLLWGLVHLYFLIGFRNRIVVLINWLWAWLTYGHGARLITGRPATPRFDANKPARQASRAKTAHPAERISAPQPGARLH